MMRQLPQSALTTVMSFNRPRSAIPGNDIANATCETILKFSEPRTGTKVVLASSKDSVFRLENASVHEHLSCDIDAISLRTAYHVLRKAGHVLSDGAGGGYVAFISNPLGPWLWRDEPFEDEDMDRTMADPVVLELVADDDNLLLTIVSRRKKMLRVTEDFTGLRVGKRTRIN